MAETTIKHHHKPTKTPLVDNCRLGVLIYPQKQKRIKQMLQVSNKIRMSIGNKWRIDDDGIMTVRARVLKEGVYPYYASELQGLNIPGDKVDVLIPASEFTPEALKTGKGKPVVIDEHEWRTVENALTDGYTKGSVAGEMIVEEKGILCDLTILDAQTIEEIKSGILVEISAGYRADFEKEDGELNGQPYSYVQKNIVFNHILLCRKGEGRCGADVKVINKKTGENKMSYTIRMKIGNKDKEMEFSSKEDADKAQEMANAAGEAKQADIDKAVEEVSSLKEQVAALNADLEEKKSSIEEYKEKLENALSEEAQEEIAEDLIAQKEAEEAVVDEEVDDKDKEEVKNSLKNMKRSERAMFLAAHVMNKRGLDIKEWDDNSKIASFMTIAAEAKQKVQNKKALSNNPSNVNGAKVVNSKTGNNGMSAKDRMFSWKHK